MEAPRSLLYGYVIALVLIYVIVAVHIPIGVDTTLPHDDELYMRLGRSLAEGRWLGAFSQFTLAKGPGYPAFLALNNWLGIPLSLGHALFHCFSITFFAMICRRFINSDLISAVLFTLLLWHPISLSEWLLRVHRDEIYYGQTLLIIGSMLWVLFCPVGGKHRALCAVFSGVVLGWFWLTREEGPWIIPGLALMVLASGLHAFRESQLGFGNQRLRELVSSLSIVLGIFVATQIGFRSIDYFVYGKFVSVDVKETNFLRALRAIHSVRSGGTKPFVSITRNARARVAAVSPAFSSVESYFENQGKFWEKFNTDVICLAEQVRIHEGDRRNTGGSSIPSPCGEIASGWFMWGLRDAAQKTGHYSSPAAASMFFRRIAHEISGACARGDLECDPQLLSEVPPVSWPDVIANRIWPRYVAAFHMLVLLNPPLGLNRSVGGEENLAAALRFLNYPLHTRPSEIPALDTYYSLSGWYYKSGREWFSAEVRTREGSVAYFRLSRHDSPDIQTGLKDPDASEQRFVLSTACADECVLELRTPEGEIAHKTLAELRKGSMGFDLGTGHIQIESANVQPKLEYALTPLDRICDRIRVAVIASYSWFFLPFLAVGLIAFAISTFAYWKQVIWNVPYVMALVCWGLAIARTTLLVVVDATTFPALYPFYLGPAYYMLVSASILSIAAFIQLTQRNPLPMKLNHAATHPRRLSSDAPVRPAYGHRMALKG